jgi:glycosyltransferase involved in cell wall biosynthesis
MIWRRLAAGKQHPLGRWYFQSQAARMTVRERRLSELFDGVITVSPEDSRIARDEYRLRNVLGDVPAGVDTDYFKPPAVPAPATTLGFLGSMDWMPNIEAVQWFAKEILPGLTDDARLVVIGRNPPRSIRDLADADPRIEVTGTVDDVRPWLARCGILVVPLLSGGGTRIKIMEALAAGLPVISTTVGAEGLGLNDGEHLLIADSAADFRDAVAGLIGDDDRRLRLGQAGRRLVEEQCGWKRATDEFLRHAAKVIRSDMAAD